MHEYFVTVESNVEVLVKRMACIDFHEALSIFSRYYRAKSKRSVLQFSTEVINGQFARAYAELVVPSQISVNDESSKLRYEIAAKHSNAFEYDQSYFFLVESRVGIEDSEGLEEAED